MAILGTEICVSRPNHSDTRPRWLASLDDDEIVYLMQCGDAGALEEFIHRFQGLVRAQARRYGIEIEGRRDWVLDLLHDVAMELIGRRVRLPQSIGGYLLSACHNRWVDARRRERRRPERDPDALLDRLEAGTLTESGGCSEHTLRASRGLDVDALFFRPSLKRLAQLLQEYARADETRLLKWMCRDLSHSEIARKLAISRSGVSHRVARLRKRLRKAALDLASAFTEAELAELDRFFHRAGVYDKRDLAGLTRSRRQPANNLGKNRQARNPDEDTRGSHSAHRSGRHVIVGER
ncbi:MAG: RNA polymerase sigma factor [Gemmatimonadaceae bacterium]